STASTTHQPPSLPDHPAALLRHPRTQSGTPPDSEARKVVTPSATHPAPNKITRSSPWPSVDRGLAGCSRASRQTPVRLSADRRFYNSAAELFAAADVVVRGSVGGGPETGHVKTLSNR